MKTLNLRRNHRLASTLATTFLVVVFALMPVNAARAKDSDCFEKTGAVQIKACTRIIQTKRVYQKSISKKNFAIAHNLRGIAYYNKGKYDRAIADYGKAINFNPKLAQAYYNRGTAYIGKGQHDRAWGIVYDKKDIRGKAIADFRKVLQIDPSLSSARDKLKALGAKP